MSVEYIFVQAIGFIGTILFFFRFNAGKTRIFSGFSFYQGTRIIVDKETGVQYLMAHWMNIGGLTVLVDKEGKPLLDPKYAKRD